MSILSIIPEFIISVALTCITIGLIILDKMTYEAVYFTKWSKKRARELSWIKLRLLSEGIILIAFIYITIDKLINIVNYYW